MYKNINLHGKLLKITETFFKKELTFFNINTPPIIIMIPATFAKLKPSPKNITDKSSKNNEFKLFIGVTSETSPVAKTLHTLLNQLNRLNYLYNMVLKTTNH